jgi:ribosomal protein S18 acetylase RimI-like enzyme
MGIEVEVVREATDEVLAAFNRLLPQLSRSAVSLDAESLRRLISWDSNTLLVARAEGVIMGTLTLVVFPIPSGVRAWIEDVVVDTSVRGRGVGAALTKDAVRRARAAGARTVDLTSRPAREAAIRLYERQGFRLRDSRVYRFNDDAADL